MKEGSSSNEDEWTILNETIVPSSNAPEMASPTVQSEPRTVSLPSQQDAFAEYRKHLPKPVARILTPEEAILEKLNNAPPVDAQVVVEDLKRALHFRHLKVPLYRLVTDHIKFKRTLPNGDTEELKDKLKKEAEKGHNEAADFGTAKIGNHEWGVYAMNYRYFAGSVGKVAGEIFRTGVRHAIDEQMPVLGVYSSSGMRQQENGFALAQMSRMPDIIRRFKRKTSELYVSLIVGNVYGGISAGPLPAAHIIGALEKSHYGFAGPDVIKNYSGMELEEGAQSVEQNLFDRNVHILFKDVNEIKKWLEDLYEIVDISKKSKKTSAKNLFRNISVSPKSRSLEALLEVEGFSNARSEVSSPEKHGIFRTIFNRHTAESRHPYDVFTELKKDSERPDTEFLMMNVFDKFVPFYSRWQEGEHLKYPAIIAGLGTIGDQVFLMIGDQASYQKTYDGINKVSASPSPEDFRYENAMLEIGKQIGVPVIFYTDTTGAKPLKSSEKNGLSATIQQSIDASSDYPFPTISIITGILGSGGGMATTPMGDHVAMLEDAQLMVAEFDSAAGILNRTSNPSKEQRRHTAEQLKATALHQLEFGIIDAIIPKSSIDPYKTADSVRKHIIKVFTEFNKMRLQGARLDRRREERMDNLTLDSIDPAEVPGEGVEPSRL